MSSSGPWTEHFKRHHSRTGPSPCAGAEALREHLQLWAKQAAREIVTEEGCGHAVPHGRAEDR